MTVRRTSAAVLASAFLLAPALPASAALADRPVGCRTVSEQPPIGEPLDGFAITHLPAEIGPKVSDFEYEWEVVAFKSRVWERGPDPSGAYSVDLTVKVLRGAGLTDVAAVREFLTEYHEKDPVEWKLASFDHNGLPGWSDERQAFWFVEPGVAVEVSLDPERYNPPILLRTACGVEKAAAA